MLCSVQQKKMIGRLEWCLKEGWTTKAKVEAHKEFMGVGKKHKDMGHFEAPCTECSAWHVDSAAPRPMLEVPPWSQVSMDGTSQGAIQGFRKINHIKFVVEGDQIPAEVYCDMANLLGGKGESPEMF